MTAAQLRTNAAWPRDQLTELDRWLEGIPHRWPHVRILAAHWRMRAAEVMR